MTQQAPAQGRIVHAVTSNCNNGNETTYHLTEDCWAANETRPVGLDQLNGALRLCLECKHRSDSHDHTKDYAKMGEHRCPICGDSFGMLGKHIAHCAAEAGE